MVAVVVSMHEMRQYFYVSHCVLFGKVAPKFLFQCAVKAFCNRCFDVFILCDKTLNSFFFQKFFERFYLKIQLLCLSAVLEACDLQQRFGEKLPLMLVHFYSSVERPMRALRKHQ